MGGNEPPIIVYLYLSWCEFCHTTISVKAYYTLAKQLYNYRYFDDICIVYLKDFDTNAKGIYENTLILNGNTCSDKWENFLDLYIRVKYGKVVTGT